MRNTDKWTAQDVKRTVGLLETEPDPKQWDLEPLILVVQ